MAYPKVEADVVLQKLFDLFREQGYSGASLSQLAEAAGLKKASLYHRFPQGKEQMASAVLDYTNAWVEAHIRGFLRRPGDPVARLADALAGIRLLYDDGRKPCILRALSLGAGTEALQPQVAGIFTQLVAGFAQLAHEFGHPPAHAQQLAEALLISMEGGLLVAGTLQNPVLFQDHLARAAARFTVPQPSIGTN